MRIWIFYGCSKRGYTVHASLIKFMKLLPIPSPHNTYMYMYTKGVLLILKKRARYSGVSIGTVTGRTINIFALHVITKDGISVVYTHGPA